MLLVDNILIGLLVCLLLLILFTFLNVHSFVGDFITSIALTIFFFYVYLKGPFVFIKFMSKNRVAIIKKVKESDSLNQEEMKRLEYMLSSNFRTIKLMYMSGAFSYNTHMIMLNRFYNKKLFKIKISFFKDNRDEMFDIFIKDFRSKIAL